MRKAGKKGAKKSLRLSPGGQRDGRQAIRMAGRRPWKAEAFREFSQFLPWLSNQDRRM